jgi:hypothetical protein
MLCGFWSRTKSGSLLLLLALTGTGVVRAADLATAQQIAARVETAPQEHPLTPALKIGDAALQKAAALRDYEALFIKKEIVGNTFLEQKMIIRFRRDPMSVYLKFVDPSPGRKVMYVQGQNNGQIQVKETGLASLVGAINVDPHGSLAMSESKYPITMIGMENMTRRLLSEWLDATNRDDITVKFYPNAKIGTVECQVVESTHTDAIKSKGIHRARLYIEKESGLPIRIQEYGFPRQAGGEPPLASDYTYLNVRSDIGLTARHFDPNSAQSEF